MSGRRGHTSSTVHWSPIAPAGFSRNHTAGIKGAGWALRVGEVTNALYISANASPLSASPLSWVHCQRFPNHSSQNYFQTNNMGSRYYFLGPLGDSEVQSHFRLANVPSLFPSPVHCRSEALGIYGGYCQMSHICPDPWWRGLAEWIPHSLSPHYWLPQRSVDPFLLCKHSLLEWVRISSYHLSQRTEAT